MNTQDWTPKLLRKLVKTVKYELTKGRGHWVKLRLHYPSKDNLLASISTYYPSEVEDFAGEIMDASLTYKVSEVQIQNSDLTTTLHLWLKESNDHQTNLDGDVVSALIELMSA